MKFVKNFRLKVTLPDGRTIHIDRKYLNECESLATRFESEGSKVEFWHLKDGQETTRFLHDEVKP